MDDFTAKATPAQSGVDYLASASLTFDSGNIVPDGESFSIKEVANIQRSNDEESDVSNVGTSRHGLEASGDCKIKSATGVVPNIGDVIADNYTPGARNWVVIDVEATGFSSGGSPVMIKLSLEYWPKVSDAIV